MFVRACISACLVVYVCARTSVILGFIIMSFLSTESFWSLHRSFHTLHKLVLVITVFLILCWIGWTWLILLITNQSLQWIDTLLWIASELFGSSSLQLYVLFQSSLMRCFVLHLHIKLFITQNPFSIKEIQIKITIYNTLHTIR